MVFEVYTLMTHCMQVALRVSLWIACVFYSIFYVVFRSKNAVLNKQRLKPRIVVSSLMFSIKMTRMQQRLRDIKHDFNNTFFYYLDLMTRFLLGGEKVEFTGGSN
jgi:hypothetical protein